MTDSTPHQAYDLENVLESVGNSSEKRLLIVQTIQEDPRLLKKLLPLCFDPKNPLSGKACRILEMLCKDDLRLIFPHLDPFIANLDNLQKNTAMRPVAKICECLSLAYFEKNERSMQEYLKIAHRQKITEVCFDWLLSKQKIAVQAHAMTCLQLLGTEFKWIHPELKRILEQNYSTGSAGYQARARMVLKKMKG